MAEKQSRTVAPPRPEDKESLDDFSSIIQGNLRDLFDLSHQHEVRTSVPVSNEGQIGDIFLVEVSGAFSLYAKFSTGWKSVSLT